MNRDLRDVGMARQARQSLSIMEKMVVVTAYRWDRNSGNYVEFLIPVAVTISEILTTPTLIPVPNF